MPANLVVDNGGGSIKWGFAGEDAPRKIMPSSIVRGGVNKRFVGDEIDNCKSFANLHFQQPCDRGYTCDWGTTQTLWERGLGKSVLNVKPADCRLLVTEPPNSPLSIQSSMDAFIFEDMGFASYYRTQASRMAAANVPSATRPAVTVVDAGFSFTHSSPVFDGYVCNYAVRRVNIGGKLLTNQLKELVSYRAMNMMNETFTINATKEATCYVSSDFARDLERAQAKGAGNELRCEYVLPDYQHILVGYIKTAAEQEAEAAERASKRHKSNKVDADEDDKQTLTLCNERFAVPELLFNPTDIGMPQGGVQEAVRQSIETCAPEIQPLLWSNILLVGGCSHLKGYKERLEMELRRLAPNDVAVNVEMAADPISHTWQGGSILASSSAFEQFCVTKKEYEEIGAEGCQRRFML